MRDEMRRIGRDGQTSARWAIAIAILTVFAVSGVTFGQWHVPEDDWVALQMSQQWAKQREPAAPAHEDVLLRLHALKAKIQQTRLELNELAEADRQEAEELRTAIERAQKRMQALEKELAAKAPEQPVRERHPRPAPLPPRPSRRVSPVGPGELIHRARELMTQIEETEIELWDLHKRGIIDSAESHGYAQTLRTLYRRTCELERDLHERIKGGQMQALHRDLRNVHAQMDEIRQNTQELRQKREEDQARQEDQMQELRGRLSGLQESTQQTNKLLEELLTMDSPATVGSAGQYWRW